MKLIITLSNALWASEGLPILDQIVSWLDFVMTWEGLVGIAIVVDLVLRLIKSEKPLSILWLIRNILEQVSVIFGKLAILLDKVLPQNVKK